MSTINSVVISCAGIGSRLGLAKTKALIDIAGKPLIVWQLEMLTNVRDIRIVVGYQAADVIKKVLQYRSDVTFVYNHNYFDSKTGLSFYLGARHAEDYVMELDGDLLVHPEDMCMLLNTREEYIAFSDKQSEDGVFVKLNEKQEVVSFSNINGDFEWTGPAVLKKDKIHYSSGHVYGIIEPYLPMKGIKIRACDIDTYEDYKRALEFIKEWR